MRIAGREVLLRNSMHLPFRVVVAGDQAGERNLVMLGVLELAKAKRQGDRRLRLRLCRERE